MKKIKEIRNDIENFWSLRVEIRVFPFFTLSGVPKPSKKLGDKKIGDALYSGTFLQGTFLLAFRSSEKAKKMDTHRFQKKNDANFRLCIFYLGHFSTKRDIFAYFCLYFKSFY